MIDKHPLDRRHLKEVLHQNEVSDTLVDLRDWAKSHLEAVLIGVLVLAALAFGTQFFLQGPHQKALESSKLLAEAQRIFQQSQGMEPAQAAQGFNQAYAKYQAVVSGYEGSPQADAARLGMANALLAQGKATEAERDYAALDSHDAKSTIAALAGLGRARSLEAQGKTPEAIAAYKQALSSYPDGPAAVGAQTALTRLNGQKK